MGQRRWTDQTLPVCPVKSKSGQMACITQCLYCFEDGHTDDGQKLYGCMMRDELEARLNSYSGNTPSILEQPKSGKKRGRPKKIVDPVVEDLETGEDTGEGDE